MFMLMFVILKLLRVSVMPKDKGDEWTHVSLVEEGGVTKDGTVRLNPLVKCYLKIISRIFRIRHLQTIICPGAHMNL